jgi:hypothetical protein
MRDMRPGVAAHLKKPRFHMATTVNQVSFPNSAIMSTEWRRDSGLCIKTTPRHLRKPLMMTCHHLLHQRVNHLSVQSRLWVVSAAVRLPPVANFGLGNQRMRLVKEFLGLSQPRQIRLRHPRATRATPVHRHRVVAGPCGVGHRQVASVQRVPEAWHETTVDPRAPLGHEILRLKDPIALSPASRTTAAMQQTLKQPYVQPPKLASIMSPAWVALCNPRHQSATFSRRSLSQLEQVLLQAAEALLGGLWEENEPVLILWANPCLWAHHQ